MKTQPSMLSLVLGATLAASGCDDSQPCGTNCPSLEGTYVMQYEAPVLQGCATVQAPQPPTTLLLSRQGTGVSAAILGVPVQGTIYDTYDFTMGGSRSGADGGTTAIDFRGKFVPGAGGPDGGGGDGASLRGTLTVSVPEGAGACNADHRFTGNRI